MREPGFYWVKHNEFKGWEIGNYVEEIGLVNQLQLKYWELLGTDTHYVDRELKEICEVRLVMSGINEFTNNDLTSK